MESGPRWGKTNPYPGRVLAIEGLCHLENADDKDTVFTLPPPSPHFPIPNTRTRRVSCPDMPITTDSSTQRSGPAFLNPVLLQFRPDSGLPGVFQAADCTSGRSLVCCNTYDHRSITGLNTVRWHGMTHNGSGAQVCVEIDLGDSNITYLPGDALGIYPSNRPEVSCLPCVEVKAYGGPLRPMLCTAEKHWCLGIHASTGAGPAHLWRVCDPSPFGQEGRMG